MSIKSQGGVFGRNPTFNDVTVDGDLSIAGTLSVGGETITGLSYQGGWNASTNMPDIAASGPVTGQFWIVSADGSTDVGGITNWTQGDWALYDGSNWQRVEGGNTDLSTGVQGQLAVANGGTGAADAATARTNLSAASSAQGALADTALQPADIGVSVQGYDATILTSSDIGSTVQGYDATILTSSDIGSTVQGYDATILTSSDIGSSVQAYDADTTKNDVANTFTATQTFGAVIAKTPANTNPLLLYESGDNSITHNFFSDSSGNGYLYMYGDGQVLGISLNSAGTSTFNNNIAFANGKGIDFSATSGTGTSELLDDYEEGTWTPAVSASSAPTVGYAARAGRYTKVGRHVTLTCWVEINSYSGGSGGLVLSGLPFTSLSDANAFSGAAVGNFNSVNLSTGQTTLGARIAPSSTSILFLQSGDNTSLATLPTTAFSSSTYFALTISYFSG